MKISQIKLHNWRQHADVDIVLQDGLNVFSGPNGSGKSNALAAVMFALVGEHGGGKKANNVTQGVGDREPSYVELDVVHHQTLLRMRRFVRGGRSWLKIYRRDQTEPEVVENERSITDAVCKELGADLSRMSPFLYLQQSDITGMFDARPADRIDLYLSLFRMDQFSRLHDILGQGIEPVPAAENPEALQQLLQDAEQAMLQAAAEEAVVSRFLGWRMTDDPAFDVLQRQRAAEASNSEALQQQIDELTARLAAERQAEAAAAEVLQAANALLAESQAKWVAVQPTAQAAAQTHAALLRETGLPAVSDMSMDAWSAWPPFTVWANSMNAIVLQPDSSWDDAAQQLLVSRQQELSRLHDQAVYDRGVADRLAASRDRCPLCLTPYSSTVLSADKATETAASSQQRYGECHQQVQDLIARNGRYTAAVAAATKLDTVKNLLSQLPSQAWYDQCRQLVATAQQQQQAASQAAATHASASRRSELTQASLFASQTAMQSRQQVQAPTPEEVAAAQLQLSQNEANATAAVRLAQQKLQTESHVTALRAQLAAVMRKRAEAGVAIAVNEELAGLRALCHRNGIPAALIRAELEQATASANVLLQRLDRPYRLSVAEDLSLDFTCRNATVPVSWASGGQKTILGIAMTIALNERYAASLGWLALDEPSTWLDDHARRTVLPEIVSCLQEHCEHGLQVIVVSHDETPYNSYNVRF